MTAYIIALDQGTTSSRTIVFDSKGNSVVMSQRPYSLIYPQPGWVEADPMTILNSQLETLAEATSSLDISAGQILGIGITNQRETTILWDKNTGRPVYNAIVWQCRRTADICMSLSANDFDKIIRAKTGLLLDPYFSGTKIRWILDNVPGVRKEAELGNILFGTVETWLIWNLTGGRIHVTDVSNASRTSLFNIHTLKWDNELCDALEIPTAMLPQIVSNSEVYGLVADNLPNLSNLAGVPICGAVGDQQAALLGQGCVDYGDVKNTYGTGCFTVMNTGNSPCESSHRLLSSVAWQIDGKTYYCLEGSVFNGGSTIQWLRDGLHLFQNASDSEVIAATTPDNGGVYLVPALSGLGAPWWDSYARGIIIGLTRGTTSAHIVRAGVESIAYQVADLVELMNSDSGAPIRCLRVDGGASVNNFLMQFQSDVLRCSIDRPVNVETTALGAAFLAGLSAGVWNSVRDILSLRESQHVFIPSMDEIEANRLKEAWHKAVSRSFNWYNGKIVE